MWSISLCRQSIYFPRQHAPPTLLPALELPGHRMVLNEVQLAFSGTAPWAQFILGSESITAEYSRATYCSTCCNHTKLTYLEEDRRPSLRDFRSGYGKRGGARKRDERARARMYVSEKRPGERDNESPKLEKDSHTQYPEHTHAGARGEFGNNSKTADTARVVVCFPSHPAQSSPSKTLALRPFSFSPTAAASPAGPAPMIAKSRTSCSSAPAAGAASSPAEAEAFGRDLVRLTVGVTNAQLVSPKKTTSATASKHARAMTCMVGGK